MLVVHQNMPDFFHDIASYVAVADAFTLTDLLFGPLQVRRLHMGHATETARRATKTADPKQLSLRRIALSLCAQGREDLAQYAGSFACRSVMYHRRDAIEGFHPARSTTYFQHAKQQRQNEALLAHVDGVAPVMAGSLLTKPALLEYWPYAAQIERWRSGTPYAVSKVPARHLVSFPDGRLRSFFAGSGDSRRRFVGAREPDESDEWVVANGDDDSGMVKVKRWEAFGGRRLMPTARALAFLRYRLAVAARRAHRANDGGGRRRSGRNRGRRLECIAPASCTVYSAVQPCRGSYG